MRKFDKNDFIWSDAFRGRDDIIDVVRHQTSKPSHIGARRGVDYAVMSGIANA